MVSAGAVFFWAFLCLSSLPVRAAPPPVPQCDGVNCFVILPPTYGAHDWISPQLAAAAPANLLELQIDMQSRFGQPLADCKHPAKLNASSCVELGLPCASMGRSFFFSPGSRDNSNLAGPASCSGTFITGDTVLTAGHCCMPLAGAWVSDVFFYTDFDDGQFSGAYAPTELIVPEKWNNFTDRRYDWCFMKMNATAPTHLKAAWAFDPGQFGDGFSAYGWPADEPYDGSKLYQATGQCQGTSPVFPPPSLDPCNHTLGNQAMMYMTCNTMNDGGGPWYDPSIGIFGVNSASIVAPGQPQIFASPYFGSDFYGSCKKAAVCT